DSGVRRHDRTYGAQRQRRTAGCADFRYLESAAVGGGAPGGADAVSCGAEIRSVERSHVPDRVEGAAAFFQPAAGFPPVGDAAFDLAPEADGVVHFLQMRHFMGGDIIQREGRGADQAPGKVETAVAAARAPARARVLDG